MRESTNFGKTKIETEDQKEKYGANIKAQTQIGDDKPSNTNTSSGRWVLVDKV